MLSMEEARRSNKEDGLLTLVREHCRLHPEKVGHKDSDRSINLEYADPGLVMMILDNCTSLELITMQCAHYGSQYSDSFEIKSLKGIKKDPTVEDVKAFLIELKQLGYCGQNHQRTIQILQAINNSDYKGKIKTTYSGICAENDFEILLKMKNPLLLHFDWIRFNNNMIQQLGKLHPVLQEISLSQVGFEDPKYFVEVLNSLQKLESISIKNPATPFDLTLLKSNAKSLKLAHIPLSTNSLQAILNNNPLIDSLRLYQSGITNELLTLLPHQKQARIKVLDIEDSKFCCSITLPGIKSLAQNYLNLIELRLVNYVKIGNNAVILVSTFQFLQKLQLRMCELSNSGLVYLKKLKNIKEIKFMDGNRVALFVVIQIFKNTRRVHQCQAQYHNNYLLNGKQSLRRRKENLRAGLNIDMEL